MFMHLVSEAGGFFIVLMFIHVLADWMAQTDTMARRKADESPWLLIVHSVAYAAMFLPVLAVAFRYSMHLTVSSFLALIMSHGAIDTYTPIWLWARFVRRPPEMRDDPVNGFTTWSTKPYGLFITLCVDQFMHACFLAPVAMMMVLSPGNMQSARTIGLATLGLAIGLAILSVITISLWTKRRQRKHPKPTVSAQESDGEDYYRAEMPSQHDE